MDAPQTGFELSGTDSRVSQTHRFEYDQETTPPSMAVVTALADVRDVDPIELDPLQTVVDTDALDAFVGVRDADRTVSATITVAGYTVTVRGDGVVTVAPSETAGYR